MRVLVFGPLRDILAHDAMDLELDTPITPRQLLEELCAKYPHAEKLLRRCRVAVDGEYVDQDQFIVSATEVAIIPPVSGGSELKAACKWHYKLSEEPIDVGAVLSQVIDEHIGAVALFIGVVRGRSKGREVIALEYDAYRMMAERKLEEIAKSVCSAYGLERLTIVHRVGRAKVGEVVLVVAASSEHRHEAIGACREVVERIKSDVPLWKREVFKDGSEWVIPETS
ncbi:MAG: molybdenum cofactor biosynthesis protein MoaE [Armatimonadota bacterium]|nr:molybdenum cofactor biosynthesis protein MoaE [Armatimonadota bacterium]MDW8026530.1 molybdenum cofactor biosynthesis protein MoaE [Armatimonadota bacterium]